MILDGGLTADILFLFFIGWFEYFKVRGVGGGVSVLEERGSGGLVRLLKG